jgi:hypothetical protein
MFRQCFKHLGLSVQLILEYGDLGHKLLFHIVAADCEVWLAQVILKPCCLLLKNLLDEVTTSREVG